MKPISRPTDIAPIKILDPIQWQDQPIPERRWLVRNLIPLDNVTLLAGDGGTGKSQIALQLMVACSLGKSWIGKPAMECKTFGFFCEDDQGELHRRISAICRYYDAELGDLENMMLCSRVGQDNVLMEWRNVWEPGEATTLFGKIINQAVEQGAQLVVLDSLHDVFTGDENRRVQARQFIQELRSMAMEISGAVLLTAHPSLSGRNTGTGEAGSTAWSNAVRSRLYLVREDGSTQGGRVLKTMKSNYGPSDGKIPLKWDSGVYAPDCPEDGVLGTNARNREAQL